MGKKNIDNINIIYNYCNPDIDDVELINDELHVRCQENYNNIWYKTSKAFEYCYYNLDFDYIFRCCSSSFINQTKLLEFIENKQLDNYYSGYPLYYNNPDSKYHGLKYGAGDGFFISKNLLPLLFSKKAREIKEIDDVAIGVICNKYLSDDSIRCGILKEDDVHNIVNIYNYYHFHHYYYLHPSFKSDDKFGIDWLRKDFNYLYNKIYS